MVFYADLNSNKVCIGIKQLSGIIQDPNSVQIESFDVDFLWRKYENGHWSKERFEPDTNAPTSEFDNLKNQNANLTRMVSNLMVENKKKDVIANNLATTIAQLNIKVNKLESANK